MEILMEIGEKITMRKFEKIKYPKNIDNLDLVLLSCLILSILFSFSMYYSPGKHYFIASVDLKTVLLGYIPE
jgi:hypothetical protein